MSGPPPAPKRKRSSLHPGSWRGKRSRTNSRSGSPPDLDTSTPGAVNPHNAAQTATHFRTPSPNGGPATLGPYLSTSGVQDDTTLGRQGIVPASPVATPGHTPNQDTNETVWEALGKALGALHITAKICPPLHSAIDGLKSCLHIFEEAARTRKDYAELATGLTAMVDLLVEHMSVAVSKEITGALASVAKNITKEVELIKKRQSLNGPRRMLGVLGDDEDLVRRYRRIEQLFRQLQAEASMSTWNDTKRHLINTQLENLGPAKLAVFNSAMSVEIGRRSCTENTRTQILVDSMAWAESPDGTKIYWMNGMAGTGKTTIAYSLCERLEATGQLAASFFCTRMSRECSNAKRIIPTIAYQLAQQSALFRNALCEALDKNPDIGAFNTTSQFDSLLARPLMESRELIERNLVVVIDALDECDDPHAVEIVLDILFRYAADLPVKFFVTSRPEPAIRNSMMSGIAECNRPQSTLYLHEIEKSLVQADIELYLKDELKGMLPAHCADIEELAEQAGNLFIYAATAVRYIRSIGKSVNSRQRLKTILGVNNQSNKSMSTIDIDTLYYSIISAAIRDDSLEPDEQKSIQAVLWTAICACEPVLIDTLAALCDFDQTDVAVSALEPLYSVLHVSDHNHFVTTLHASFPNFMFSKERSQEFFCDKSIHDQFLARRCLDIMKAQLRFNICGLESSFILDDKIPDLKARVESRISLELFYASRFWVDHLSQGGAPSSLLELTYEFLSQRLLFWMEVLNLTKFMVVGAVASTKAHMWLRASDASPEMIALARDAQIFVGKYAANQVSESTPHIYLSALALSLPTSLIRSHYLPKFRGLVQAQGTFVERTDQAPLETWPIGSPARSVSFSVDRKHIVIGVDDGRVIVKNSHTGETILDFKAHHKAISSATFSNDGRLVVSSSHDCTICIWSALNGSLASGPFKGHSKQVNSVVFSPDDMRLASGAEDHTVRTWTTRDISASQILTGHTAAVRSVAFSPNGLQIASGSSDHTVRIWDALNGIPLHSLQGHSQSVTCVRFSLCGDFVFSGSHDSTIRMWDTHHGTAIGNPSKDLSQPVTSIAVSPEGERIASGSLDHTVRVWHRGSGKLVAGPFEGHTDSVRSVEFSADGACIVSASDDKSVRLWNAQGKVHPDTTDKPLEATADTVRCLEFINLHQTNDTEYLARGSAADVWKVTTPKLAGGQFALYACKVLRISPDCFESTPENDESLDSPRELISRPSWKTFVRTYQRRVLEWSPLNHQNVVRVYAHDQNLNLHVELCSNGSVRNCLQSPGGDRLDKWKIICDLLDGLEYLHSRNPPVIHGSLNAGKLFIDLHHTIKIGEFGLAALCFPFAPLVSSINFTGFSRWMSPELLDIDPDAEVDALPTKESDVWALACTILEIFTGKLPFSRYNHDIRIQKAIISGELPGRRNDLPHNKAFSAIWEILESCWSKVPSQRPQIFSIKKSVGLTLSSSGLSYGTQPAAEHGNSYKSGNDGWIMDENSNKVIWVPPELRDGLPQAIGTNLAKQSWVTVDYDGILIGEKWSQCYVGE